MALGLRRSLPAGANSASLFLPSLVLAVAVLLLAAAPATAQFILIEDFESLVPGDIAGQRSWSAAAHTSFEVAVGPIDPANQVLSVLDNTTQIAVDLYNDDPNLRVIDGGTTASLFFRVYRGGGSVPHLNLGLSDMVEPGETYSDFEAQMRFQTNDLDVIFGGGFETLESSTVQNEWYSIWMIIDNAADQWELYVQSPTQYPEQTRLVSGSPIDFRNGVASNDLLTFFMRSDFGFPVPHQGPWYLDDLYLDQGQPNLQDPTGSGGPPPDTAVNRIVLEDFFVAPETFDSPPFTRINVLRESPDGSGRLFLNDLRGPLHVIDGDSTSVYMDLFEIFSPNMKTSPGLASGFVSFDFHPEFATNGLFYTVHSEFENGTPNITPPKAIEIIQHSVLTEFTATNPSSNTFSGTSRELMRIASPHIIHNVQEIAFNPNSLPMDADYGLLYMGAGDFGTIALNDPDQLQRLDTVYGAVLRIDPLGGPFMRGGTWYDYGIPPDNPYADHGDPETLGEIYAHGFRNAHRLIWDPAGNGSLFVTDIGEDNREEINLLVPGRNYGWPFREGNRALDPFTNPGAVFALPSDDELFGYTYPVAQYNHPQGRAIAGGIAFRGAKWGFLNGRFLFGDILTGEMWTVAIADLEAADDGDPTTLATLDTVTLEHFGVDTTLLRIVHNAASDQGIGRTDLRFHIDPSGNAYITTKQDGFVRVIPEPGQEGLFMAAIVLLAVIRRAAESRGGALQNRPAS